MLKLEQRPQASKFWTYGSPILALLITVLVGVCLFALLGKDPVKGLQAFFWEPIRSGYALGELAVKATPLLLIALGLAVCFRSNVWNIGAEGQFVIGAVAAGGMALLADKTTGPWIVPAILIAGMLGGMVWAGIVALLRDRFNANEILVSLMLVYVGTLVLGYLVYGPWKDPMGYNFPQTKSFERVTQIPRLVQGMRMNIGVIISLVGAGLLWAFLFRTRAGFAAGRRPGAVGGTLCRLFLAQGAVDGAADLRRHSRSGGSAGSRWPSGSAHALCARRLRLCGHHRGLCGAPASCGHDFLGHSHEHVLYRWRAGAVASGPAQGADRRLPGLLLFALLACDTLVAYRIRWVAKKPAAPFLQ
jgi:simple sugar transport system permease protein